METQAPSEDEAAHKAMDAYMAHKLHLLQLFLLSGYGVMFVLCGLLICYMRYNRNVALRGDVAAARQLILPAFEPLLWILGAATGIYTTFFATALGVKLYTTDIPEVSSELFYCGRQFVLVSVLVFLCQKSVSIPALRRTLLLSFLISSYTVPIVWYVATYTSTGTDFLIILMGIRAPLLLLYVYVYIWPPSRASKRTLREFCMFAFVYYAFLYAYIELLRQGYLDTGFALAYTNLVWGSMCPLVIWRVLKADTEYWRGLGQRAVALQGLYRQRRSALDERVSSQGLHVLIEMHRKHVIDFAHLDVKEKIGQGGSSTVFRGVLHSNTHVAVKVYTPRELSEETVAGFSHEAALCGALRHPNIVKFYGMCVSPPTICLVSELCIGSLRDVMAGVHRRRDSNPNRQQFLIDLAYMIDAARAVAYLHSFSPPFVHRDIKPSNFLVDFKGSVKLTDFGESRSLPRPSGTPLHPYMLLASGAHVNQQGRYSGNANMILSSSSGPIGSNLTPVMSVRGTVDYMAPEVINGRAGTATYGEGADIYSLAITMWDVLHPGREKFPMLRDNHLQIFESVIEGKRPALDEHLHAGLRHLIQSAWHSDVRQRPSAEDIVHILEDIQEEMQAVFAAQLVSEIDTESIPESARSSGRLSSPLECSFTGAEAVSHMVDSGYAMTENEAIRLGNALLDSGHLHHLRHASSFENDVGELYYFDEDNISLCQPIHPLMGSREKKSMGQKPMTMDELEEEEETKSNGPSTNGRRSRLYTSSSSSDLSRSARSGRTRPRAEQQGLCACRKLGQRFEASLPQSSKRKARNHKFRTRIGTVMEEMSGTGLTRSLLAEEDHVEVFEDHIAINMGGAAGA